MCNCPPAHYSGYGRKRKPVCTVMAVETPAKHLPDLNHEFCPLFLNLNSKLVAANLYRSRSRSSRTFEVAVHQYCYHDAICGSAGCSAISIVRGASHQNSSLQQNVTYTCSKACAHVGIALPANIRR
eukprot:TRINITY_DN2481_c0_g1_i1.p1 TRINITY_DN2481_c0_g1~~TRINITY_DN2481_c0_g1_i1.p1  ORF type:complete len:127 (+),score=4.19 TRINITY_DN2481_c0_g1_i1:69-449(+)